MLYRSFSVRGTRNGTFTSVPASGHLGRNLRQVLVVDRRKGFCCSPCEVLCTNMTCFTVNLELTRAKIGIPPFTFLKRFIIFMS